VPPTAGPPTAGPPTAVPQTWDIQADVVVVGFGAAGACAALEATAAGRDVVVLDRFAGGGATALSGGVIYAGGGTPHQLAAGVRDSPEAMVSYLSLEVGYEYVMLTSGVSARAWQARM
jgi:3-oxo-5alpha-steroid 4-dehydrogenase